MRAIRRKAIRKMRCSVCVYIAKKQVIYAVFCFRLFESALTQVCFKAYFVQPALSPPLLYARGFITVIHAAQP